MSAIARTCKGDIFASSSDRPTNPSMVSAMASSPGVFVAEVWAGFRAWNKPETADRRARSQTIAIRTFAPLPAGPSRTIFGWHQRNRLGRGENGTRTQRCRLGRPLSHEQVDRHAGGRLPAEVRSVSRG